MTTNPDEPIVFFEDGRAFVRGELRLFPLVFRKASSWWVDFGSWVAGPFKEESDVWSRIRALAAREEEDKRNREL